MPTLEEIAHIAKVSRSTVSRVINDDPNVSQRTRQRVEEVIERMRFKPNRAARILAGGRTHVLGLVIPTGVARLFMDPYFPILIQSITAAASDHEHTIMLWLEEPENERRLVDQIIHNGLIDGVLIASSLINDSLVESLLLSRIPFVVIGRFPNNPAAHFVDVDNCESARAMVHHLLERGRRRIAHISGPQNMIAGLERQKGYHVALADWGLDARPELVVDGGFSEEGGFDAMQTLLAHAPEAVFAASDSMAVGALRAIQKAGLHVPGDIAVGGFDDLPFAVRSDPPLTTIRQPIQHTGAAAVETLIDVIQNPGGPPRQVTLPAELVVRSST